jgi:hypothetical protein
MLSLFVPHFINEIKSDSTMLKKTILGFSLAALLLAWGSGCTYDSLDVEACDPPATASFANDIAPILGGSCNSASVACHATGNFNNADLDSYAGVKLVVDNGKLISSITWDGVATNSRMPSGSSSKIEQCSIDLIQQWIDEGAPNN